MKSYLRILSAICLFTLTGLSLAASEETAVAPKVIFETSMGNIELTLYPEKAPVTVENFLSYVDAGFYNGTIFHRVIPGFVIQGGGFDSNMARKSTQAPIINESKNGLANRRATLSMARTNNINSATSQFFINLVNNPALDGSISKHGYAVFAKVSRGMEIVDAISQVKTGNYQQFRDVPSQPVIILSAQRSEQ